MIILVLLLLPLFALDLFFTKGNGNFLIKGLPKLILVDPDGNFVSSNAPAPSQGEN